MSCFFLINYRWLLGVIVCPKSWVVFAFCNGIDIGEFWDIKTLASFKSLAPGRCGNNAKSVISEHMLWIKSEGMFVKLICKHLWWHLNIGSDNGLVPSDNKQVIIWTNVEPDLLRLKCLKRNSFLWYPNISISNGSCESNIWPKKLPPCIHSNTDLYRIDLKQRRSRPSDRKSRAPGADRPRPQREFARAPLAASNSTDTTAFATGYIACTVHRSLNIVLQTTWLCTQT